MNFWECISHVIPEEMPFEVFFLPYGPMLTKTKKKKNHNKSKMQNFEKKKIVWRYGEEVPFHHIWH